MILSLYLGKVADLQYRSRVQRDHGAANKHSGFKVEKQLTSFIILIVKKWNQVESSLLTFLDFFL